jgi:hypothetical protein
VDGAERASSMDWTSSTLLQRITQRVSKEKDAMAKAG